MKRYDQNKNFRCCIEIRSILRELINDRIIFNKYNDDHNGIITIDVIVFCLVNSLLFRNMFCTELSIRIYIYICKFNIVIIYR